MIDPMEQMILLYDDNMGTGETAWDTEANKKADVGLRFDTGKERVQDIPPEFLLELGRLYSVGAEKYAPKNWMKGMDWGKVQGSLMRHYLKWSAGEQIDEETGVHHMIAVAWNAAALYYYQTKGLGTDDRGL